MIKNYNQFNESLLGNMKVPTDDEIIIFLKKNDPNKLLDIGLQRNNFEFVKTAIDNGANPHVNNDSLFKCPVQRIVDLLKKILKIFCYFKNYMYICIIKIYYYRFN